MSFSDVATDRQKVVASSSSLEQALQRARSGRVPTCMRDEIGKRAERAVQHALAKSERVHLLRRNAGLRLVSFAPIARKVIKTAGPTSTASPVRADLVPFLARLLAQS